VRPIIAAAFGLALGHVVLHGAAPEALTYDHIHLAFPDTRAATEWYIKYLGATARPDGMDGVFFGPIRFNMRKAAGVVGSRGSVIDAVGLSYADLQGRLRILLDGSGVKLVQPEHAVEGIGRMAVIEDPWGTKIELVQDPQVLGFHHARVLATDPAAMRAWFVEKLGAEPGSIRGSNALKFGGIWLIIDKAETAPRASDGSTLDHLGFRTKDIKTEIANLQASEVKVLGEPRQDPNVATTFATFFGGPTGRIELTQR
jgi:catechol 2,3-dioxygenase-like lactoylglutathione lyase family enzyme/predicted enzyme related to lactoylglutathione lyase